MGIALLVKCNTYNATALFSEDTARYNFWNIDGNFSEGMELCIAHTSPFLIVQLGNVY